MIHTLELFGYQECIYKFIEILLQNDHIKVPKFEYFVKIFH